MSNQANRGTERADTRYERKFYVTGLMKTEVEAIIMLHPAIFREIYEERAVNNLYMDSPGFASYFESVQGLMDRTKVRVRWYGESFGLIREPVLEFKSKRGHVGGKQRYRLVPFRIDEQMSRDSVAAAIRESELPRSVLSIAASLEVSMLNRYRRKYYRSADGAYRITVDSGLESYRVDRSGNTFLDRSRDDLATIMELKYDVEADEGARRISSWFPFRMTKGSKYVRGIERLTLW